MKKYELATIEGKNVVLDVSQLLQEEVLYINATRLSKQFGKDRRNLHKFLNSDSFKEYENAISKVIKMGDFKTEEKGLKYSTKGKYGGTYIRSDLIVFFLRWLDVDFAVQCDLYLKHKIQDAHNDKIIVRTTAETNLANENFFKLRQDGKKEHRSFTDAVKMLCEYAEGQRAGSYGAKCPYYKLFQSLTYKSIGIKISKSHKPFKDSLSPEALEQIENVEKFLANKILGYIDFMLPYRDIYSLCKKDLKKFKDEVQESQN